MSILLLILLDINLISALRRLLLDFLIGRRNRKSMEKIHAAQPSKQRLTLSYIKPYLVSHVKQFDHFHKLYLVVFYSLIPQYVLALICYLLYFLLTTKSIYLIVGFILLKFILFMYVRFQFDDLWRSKYRKKK